MRPHWKGSVAYEAEDRINYWICSSCCQHDRHSLDICGLSISTPLYRLCTTRALYGSPIRLDSAKYVLCWPDKEEEEARLYGMFGVVYKLVGILRC